MEARPPAEDLIVRSFQGALDPAEWAELRAWRDASAQHEAHYRSLARVWELTGESAPTPLRSSPPPLDDVLRAASPDGADPPGGEPQAQGEPLGSTGAPVIP